MKKVVAELGDELRSEYDLKSLQVRKTGPGRKKEGRYIIQLDSDVAQMFPDAEAVNEALRFLIRAAKNKNPVFSTKSDT